MTALYCQKDPGSPPFSSPARCILAQRPQLVKSSRSPNATRNLSSLPLPPPARPLRSPTALRRANVFFFPHTFRKGLGARNSAPSTCPRGATRAFRHPWDGQTSAILFSNSMVSPDARQKIMRSPKAFGSFSRQNNRNPLLASRPNCRTSSKSAVI